MSNEQVKINQALVEQLFRRYGHVVERRALALLGNRAAAADAAQEVFIKVLQRYEQFRGDAAPMTWLYRVTTNHCLNQLRNDKRRSELRAELVTEERCSGRRLELGPDLRRVLQRLPEKVAAAGVYYFLDGMTHEEIAKLLGVSRRTAGNWVERFQKRLHEQLG